MTAAVASFVAAMSLLACVPAQAQDYPGRPIHLVVTNSAGSGADLLGRVVGNQLAEALKQPVVIENRPGANGTIGMDYVAKSAPDGYTIGVAAPSTMTINQFVYRKVPFNALTDLTPVAQLTSVTIALVVNPALNLKSVKDLVEYGKRKPDGLNYSSSGVGNLGHLAGELFATQNGIKAVHVPAKGDAPALLDVMSGQTDFMFASLPGAAPQIRGGKLAFLAVAGPARNPTFPNVPTMAEAGLPAMQVDGWAGLVVPAGTPPAVIDKIQAAVARQFRDPRVRALITSHGDNVTISTPVEFQKFIAQEAEKWSRVIKTAGIQAND